MAEKPEYRLAALLELRNRKKEDAERQLGAAVTAHKAEVDRQRALEIELARLVARREQKQREHNEAIMRGAMSAQEVSAAAAYLDRLRELAEGRKHALEVQKARVAEKDAAVGAARHVLVQAAKDLEALERHREKAVAQWQRTVQGKEEEAMDESAQQRFRKGERW